jgi:hypothetical protein
MLQILRCLLPLLEVASGPYGRRKVLIKLFSELASVNCLADSFSLLGTGIQLSLGLLVAGLRL